MRRQTAAGVSLPAGSSRSLRLDPRSLPVRFALADAAADGCTRTVELDRTRVLLRRSVRGVRMRFHLPLSEFLGISVRFLPSPEGGKDTIAIVLEHNDSCLSVPLHVAADSDDVIADWQLWARVLRKPLLVPDCNGRLREPFARMGGVGLHAPVARRVRRTALRKRRPKMARRRVCNRRLEAMPVHRGEREIIARN